MDSNLTSKQARFVKEYLIDLNASAAATRAGYSEKTAANIAHELLKKPLVMAAIQREFKRLQKKTEISQEDVIKEERCIAFFLPTALFNPDGSLIPPEKLPEPVARAIASIEISDNYDKEGNKETRYKYRFWDKGKSLERLSRHLGLYNDSIRIQTDEGLRAILDSLPEDIRQAVMNRVEELSKKK